MNLWQRWVKFTVWCVPPKKPWNTTSSPFSSTPSTYSWTRWDVQFCLRSALSLSHSLCLPPIRDSLIIFVFPGMERSCCSRQSGAGIGYQHPEGQSWRWEYAALYPVHSHWKTGLCRRWLRLIFYIAYIKTCKLFRFSVLMRSGECQLESVRASLITWKRPRKHLSKNDGNALSRDV